MTQRLNVTSGENHRAVMAMVNQLQVDSILFLANPKMGSKHARPASDLADAGVPHYGK